MKCENYFCVYQDNYECTIADTVEIGLHGQCTDCVNSEILETELRRLKKEILERELLRETKKRP